MTQVAPLEQACQQQAAVNSAVDAEAAGREESSTPVSGTSSGSHIPMEIHQALLPKAVVQRYEHPFGPWRRRYMVGLVSVIAALLCADQNLLAPNLSAAAAYFGLDSQQKDTFLGGYLMAAFFLIGAPAALLCGYLADKHNRVLLLASIIIIGEAPCLCTYWVTELWQFFVLRMLTGVAVGGCFPLVFSLLGDLFPVSQRSAMAALVQIAVGAGIGGGQLLAGLVGPATNWRVPFVIMAAPSLLLALLLIFTVQEPPRGAFEEALRGQLAAGAAYSESISWRKVRQLLSIPSNWIIILQGLPGCLPWGVMQTFINDYLHLNKGYSVEMSTVIILLFGIGGGVGVLAGGAAGQLLYNLRKESMAVLTGLSVLAGVGPVYFLVNADLQAAGYGAALVMSALAGFLVSIAGPNLRAIMINVNTPETRGVSLALQSVTDDLGRGLGPVIVAGFISALGRQGAFNLSVAGWVPCGLLLCCLVFTMRKDEEQMQQRLTKTADAMLQQIQVMRGSGTGGGEVRETLSVHAGSSSGGSSGWSDHGSSRGIASIQAAEKGEAAILIAAEAPEGKGMQQHGMHQWPGSNMLSSAGSPMHVVTHAHTMSSPSPAVERALGGMAAARQRPGSDTGQPSRMSPAGGYGTDLHNSANVSVRLKSRLSDPGGSVVAGTGSSSSSSKVWFAGRIANSAVLRHVGPIQAEAASSGALLSPGRLPDPMRNSSQDKLLQSCRAGGSSSGGALTELGTHNSTGAAGHNTVSSSKDGRGGVGLSAAAGWISRRGIHLRGRGGSGGSGSGGSGSGGSSSGSGSGGGGGPLGEACEVSAATCAFEHSGVAGGMTRDGDEDCTTGMIVGAGIADIDAVTAVEVAAAAEAAACVGVVACDAVAATAGVEAAGAMQ